MNCSTTLPAVGPASFEPSIDYIVTKIPRFTFEKFPQADNFLTTQMKSVGEVMKIGRTFQESLQKALRGLNLGIDGLSPVMDQSSRDWESNLRKELREAGAERIRYVADAMRFSLSLDEIFELTQIDPWFLVQLADLVTEEQKLVGKGVSELETDQLFSSNRKVFRTQTSASF